MFGFSKRKNEELLLQYKQIKKTAFDFEQISLLFQAQNHEDTFQKINYKTLQDLDFEELFMFLDRTISKIGQQELYNILRTIPQNNSRTQRYEKIISELEKDSVKKESSINSLNKLSNTGAYFLQRLIYGETLKKPKWFWVIQSLSVSTILSFALVFIIPQVFIPILTVLITANFIFHYWNKKNILTYSNAIPQLSLLYQTGNNLLKEGAIFYDHEAFESSLKSIHTLSKKASFFTFEMNNSGEFAQLGQYVGEVIKSVFLIEPIIMFQFTKGLETKRNDLETVFKLIAELDVALSIDSFRESLSYYCLPNIGATSEISIEGLYHPLIVKPVANNTMLTSHKSMLITGSNMSGKTTFIRTVGINTLLAQTINTVCAQSFTSPRIQIHSAIKIADNLLDDTSYYYEEVKVIKKIIEASASEHPTLILLDELFKGTNTVERIASGKAVLSHLNAASNYVLVTTHDLELTELLKDEYTTYHFPESIENNELNFSYQLTEGKSVNTNAIKILEINGFPENLTNDAKSVANILFKLKKHD